MDMQIKINCECKHYLPFREIKIIQDADDPLKELSKEAYQGLKKSILEFGIISPIHVWIDRGEYKSLDGTQRLKTYEAMENEGYIFPDVPCVFIKAFTELDARKMLLALVSQYGKLTDQGLYEYVVKNQIDLKWLEETTRLPEIDLNKFINSHFELDKNENDPDEIPEVKHTDIKLGDMFQLGNHKLLCGDSTNIEDVERLMNGEKADMVFTDPPYNISFSNNSLPKKSYTGVRDDLSHNHYDILKNDDKLIDLTIMIECFSYVKEMFIWGANNFTKILPVSTWICWDRKLNESADKNLCGDFDLCWSKNKHKMKMYRVPWYGVFGHNKIDDGSKKVHPTMKPVKLISLMLVDYSNEKDIVVDLFLGSGSTLIACEKTGRKCYGIEIDPHYCQVIIDRWEQYTGQKAEKI